MPRTNLEMLQIIAVGLAELKDQVVFVGGAVAGLYLDQDNLTLAAERYSSPSGRPADRPTQRRFAWDF